jgi:hypothetical protein
VNIMTCLLWGVSLKIFWMSPLIAKKYFSSNGTY